MGTRRFRRLLKLEPEKLQFFARSMWKTQIWGGGWGAPFPFLERTAGYYGRLDAAELATCAA